MSDSIDILVPEFGHGLTEALVIEWLVSVGDTVERGDVIAVLETDKSSVDLLAEKAGHHHGDRRSHTVDHHFGCRPVQARRETMKGETQWRPQTSG